MRAVIACGGTGGHLFPGLAVAEVLRDRGHEVLLLVSEKEIDTIALREHPGFESRRLKGIGMPALFSLRFLKFIGCGLQDIQRCRSWYSAYKPDIVLGMGGFTSTAPLIAASLSGIPGMVHESNAIPGKANRLNARFSRKILLGFEECARFFSREKCVITGTPVRASMKEKVDRAAVFETFRMEPGRPVLLVMGGSQGAHGINTAMARAAADLDGNAIQIIHFTGGGDERMMVECYKMAGIRAYVTDFHHRMQDAYAVADVALSRAGASSVTELSWFGIPAVLVPYPHAAEDHQMRNAEIFQKAGAAILLPEEECSPDVLSALIKKALSDSQRTAMKSAMLSLAPKDAAAHVANLMEETCRK
jgi:UDP-N-acetylglucosamine--N-acetylmuramyl-(pentapeptide) pyrophosphoryl-undecaprenol N-acetylglucosamine transferase